MLSMRTTITIEDALLKAAKIKAANENVPLKDVINEAIRRGLEAMDENKTAAYKTRPRPLGIRPGIDPDRIGQAADELDDEHRTRESQ